MRIKLGLILAALGIVALSMAATAQSVKPAILGNTCFSCHGTDGRSVGAMPSLAGKSASYIAEKMRTLRSGDEESTVMGRIAKGFSEAEIDAVASYLGSN